MVEVSGSKAVLEAVSETGEWESRRGGVNIEGRQRTMQYGYFP